MDKGKSVIQHVDPCKLRVLLCDTNEESCREILAPLCKCSYQDAVWSVAEVFETLNSRGPLADIILVEIGLLMANDAHLLRHIMRQKTLQQIPVINDQKCSALLFRIVQSIEICFLTMQDQITVTMNALRLGAAGYLVKPLQHDELSNLQILLRN